MDDLTRIVLEPEETLEIELKAWLDLTAVEHKAKLAKELIALANHGGGLVILGIDDKSLAAINRPDGYAVDADAVNGIVARYADPVFHCSVREVEGHPVIGVPGNHTVPIRATRGSPNGEIQQYAYYIRRAGPNSEVPQNGLEWDELIRRCIDNREAELEAMVTRVAKALQTEPREPDRTAADRIRDLL